MPTAHTSQTPASGDVANGAAITTGVHFMVASAAPCSAIAFYAPGTNSGTYTAALYQTTGPDSPGPGTGTLLTSASLSSASVTAGAWNNIPITAQNLSTGVVYTAAVHSSSGRIVATSHGLDSAITAGGVTLLADGADPVPPGLGGTLRNGVFVEGASVAYPTDTFNANDYFVDVILGNTVTGTATAALGGLTAAATGLRTVIGTASAALGGLSAVAAGGAVIPPRTLLVEGPRRKGVTPLDSTRGTPSFRRRR